MSCAVPAARLQRALLADCRTLLSVPATTAPEALAEASRDFGGIVHRRPRAVVYPADTAAAARVVRYAARCGLKVCPRGAGHSQGGQSLSDGGLILDLRRMQSVGEIDPHRGSLLVEAGAHWKAVLDATLPRGLRPPVLTDNPHVTVGGTHSIGGIGPASFRHGIQAGHCLAAEVVTGEGEVVWCSRDRDPALFRHVLGGLGQFGVLTRIRHRLRPCRPWTRVFHLVHDRLAALLAEIRQLAAQPRVESLGAWAVAGAPAGPAGAARAWSYHLEVTVEMDVPEHAGPGLDSPCGLLAGTQDIGTAAHTLRLADAFAPARRGEGGGVQPWVELFMPWDRVETLLEELLPAHVGGSVLLWPLGCRGLGLPMFRTPETELAMLVGMFPSIPGETVEQWLPRLHRVSARGMELGGRRYLSGWIDFDPATWRRHFGDLWTGLRNLKRTADPHAVLGSDFLPLE